MSKVDDRRKHLKPFKKGEDERRNLNGRPLGSLNRATVAERWMKVATKEANPLTQKDESLSQEDLITLAMIKEAKSGSTRAYRELMDSLYGMPKQKVESENIQRILIVSKDDKAKLDELKD